MGKISVIINVVDEEVEVLPRAIKSVENLASEIVIIDMTSNHELKDFKLKNNCKVRVYPRKRAHYVELVRNFGIDKAQEEWLLIIDPDEEIPTSLVKRLKKIATSDDNKRDPSLSAKGGQALRMTSSSDGILNADYFRIPRKNIIFEKWIKHSGWWPDYNIRFFKKGSVSWNGVIHAVPMTKGKGLDLEADEKNAVIHYHYTSIEQYISRMNRYTSAQAENLVKKAYKFKWQDLIKKPTSEFLSRYFQGEGYKDGVHGLALAGLQAFSEFVVCLKIWSHSAKATRDKQLEVKDVMKVMKEAESDFRYWQADTLLKEGGGIVQRIKRKFKLP